MTICLVQIGYVSNKLVEPCLVLRLGEGLRPLPTVQQTVPTSNSRGPRFECCIQHFYEYTFVYLLLTVETTKINEKRQGMVVRLKFSYFSAICGTINYGKYCFAELFPTEA